MRMAIRWLPVRKPWNSPWKISHSLTNPFSGGSAAIPSVPAKAITEALGIRCASPPSRSMSRGAVAGEGYPGAFGRRWRDPAEPVHVACSGGVLYHPGFQEQQRLVASVVGH